MSKKSEALYTKAVDEMEAQIIQACRNAGHQNFRVFYSAYESDADDVPINNLDSVVANGQVRFVLNHSEFFGGRAGRDYQSEVLEHPTFLQAAVCANKAIMVTNDLHHIFFEGVHKLPDEEQTEPGVVLYKLVMGS